ncbi:MAG: hypothetical protein IKS40_01255 [Treponema sp.]|nr:hypothetical protein [Treponema sp.]
MKFSKKLLSCLLGASMLSGAVFADDFGFDDGGSGFGDSGDFSESSSSSSALSVNGEAVMEGRLYVDKRDSDGDRFKFADFPTDVFPMLRLGIDYTGAYTDFSAKIKLNKYSLGNYKQDILEEFTARVYVNSNLQLEAGKMKVVWGKGDKLHVLDNFNANDYTDYIIPDYIDRRIAEPMFRAVFSTESGFKLEGIYTPTMTPDRLATSGTWQPKATKFLTQKVTQAVGTALATLNASQTAAAQAAAAVQAGSTDAATIALAKTYPQAYSNYLNYQTNALSIMSDPSSIYPDTFAFKYGQAGLRTTFTLGPIDLGASYYYGHYKQPTANLSVLVDASNIDNIKKNLLHFDRVQIFGLEAAFILWRFNTRAEFAYNLTEDTAGDDPWVKNNSLAWVGGFDIDLPIHNVNLNVQEQGSYILKNDKIDSGDSLSAAYKKAGLKDCEYDAKGRYTNNKIVVALTDSWDHEKTKVDIKGIWGIERSDVIVMPKLSRNIFDGFDLSVSGLFIWCKDENSEFNGWEHNSFVTLGAKYQF